MGKHKLFPPKWDKLEANSDRIRERNKQYDEHLRKTRIVSEKALYRRITF